MFQRMQRLFPGLPPITENLLIINVLVWLACVILPRILGVDLVRVLGLHFPIGGGFYPHQLFTYMFLDDTSSPMHLFFNMFSLFMFGRVLETTWGSKRFLIYYVISGIGAGLIQQLAWLFDYRELIFSAIQAVSNGQIASVADFPVNVIGAGRMTAGSFLQHLVTIGASGSVFALLLAFGMLFPNAEMYMWFIPIPIKAKYFVVFYGIVELLGGVANFSFDNVAHFAHLGGMLFGYLMIKYWKKQDFKNGRYFY